MKRIIAGVALAAVLATAPAAAHIPAHCDNHRADVFAALQERTAAWETWSDAVVRDGGHNFENFSPLMEAYKRMSDSTLRWLECIDGGESTPQEGEQ